MFERNLLDTADSHDKQYFKIQRNILHLVETLNSFKPIIYQRKGVEIDLCLYQPKI